MHTTIIKSFTLLLFLPLSVFAQEAIDESRSVSSNERISIEVLSGEVTIRGSDDNLFRVRGTLAESADGYTLDSNNGFTRFEVEIPQRGFFNWRDHRDADQSNLEIEVPMGAELEFEGVNIAIVIEEVHGSTNISTVNGDIDANNLSNIVELSTVNGTIENRHSNGRIELSSVNGEIFDEESSGRISYNTVNGEIVAASNAEEVSVNTVNGDAEIELIGSQVIELSTVNGDIEIRLTQSLRPRIEGSTVSGDISIEVEPEISAHFSIDAHAGGNIENGLSNDQPTRDRYGPSKHLNFSTKDSQGSVNLSTVSGDIEIDEL